jgi:SnoaL-like domain
MSEENVELVRRMHAEFEQTLRATPEFLAPGFIWDMSAFQGWPDDAVYEGLDGFDRFFEAWRAPWDDWKLEINDVVDVGADEVLVLMHQWGTPKGGRARVGLDYGTVYTVAGGVVTRARVFGSPEEAREAAGLADSAGD